MTRESWKKYKKEAIITNQSSPSAENEMVKWGLWRSEEPIPFYLEGSWKRAGFQTCVFPINPDDLPSFLQEYFRPPFSTPGPLSYCPSRIHYLIYKSLFLHIEINGIICINSTNHTMHSICSSKHNSNVITEVPLVITLVRIPSHY
jgi:hypothetical protein